MITVDNADSWRVHPSMPCFRTPLAGKLTKALIRDPHLWRDIICVAERFWRRKSSMPSSPIGACTNRRTISSNAARASMTRRPFTRVTSGPRVTHADFVRGLEHPKCREVEKCMVFMVSTTKDGGGHNGWEQLYMMLSSLAAAPAEAYPAPALAERH